MEYLREPPELELVLLAGTKVTDVGLTKVRGLPRLHTLILNDTVVTAEGINGLRRSFPNIVVRWEPARRSRP